ncbi:MAG: glycosyltransferase family 39 protein, partial [Prevotella sp.]|nr:glycosyltransferase family 39 protein [Prevotella sp.]
MGKLKKLLPVVVVIFLIAGLCGYYSAQKAGMFIDEIYTYGLSNSEYKPFVYDISGGDLTDQTITKQQFLDYLTVQEGEQFHFGSVYYNQTQDVHPPLYYWLIHTVSSFFPDSFSKWIGLGINGVVFAATLVVLFLLTQKLFENRRLAVLTAALYGLSTIALSTMLMIRMYMLLTFFTVLLAWLIAKLL